MYDNESVIFGSAYVMGDPAKVDTNTLDVNRGRFAKICMEIDLTLPVVRKVNINGQWYNVQCEGLHIIYSKCDCHGHHTRDFKKIPHNLTQSVVLTMA